MESSLKNNNELKQSKLKGISLIVLVITIIVIVILAVAVILSIANNNPIEQAKKAKFQNDLKTMQDELNVYIASQVSDPSGNFDIDNLNVKNEEINSVIKSATSEWLSKIQIEKGKLIFIGQNEQEMDWAYEVLKIPKEITIEKKDQSIKLSNCINSNIIGMKIYGNNDDLGDKTVNEFKSSTISVPAGITATYDKVTGIYTINGTSVRASNIWLSNKFIPEIDEGENVTLTSQILSGTIDNNNNYIYYSMFNDTTNNWIRYELRFLIKKGSIAATDKMISGNYMKYCIQVGGAGVVFDNVKLRVQLEKGSKFTKYEPYGYRVPININGKNANIYIDEPLRRVGDYADYIDTETQKVYRHVKNVNGEWVGSNEVLSTEDIEISELILEEGKNDISIQTTVAPSKIEITYMSK